MACLKVTIYYHKKIFTKKQKTLIYSTILTLKKRADCV